VTVLTTNENDDGAIIIIMIIIAWNVFGIAQNMTLTGQKLSYALVQCFGPHVKLNLMVE
jgi:hypothetical protein